MHAPDLQPLTLFDLLGRSWRCPAAVASLCFSGDGAAVAFACTDGRVAIAALADPEPPETRMRVSADLGRTTIRPRREPPAPLAMTTPLAAGAPPLAAAATQFLVGAGNGAVLRLSAAAKTTDAGIRLDGPVTALAHAAATRTIAAASAGDIVVAQVPGSQRHLAAFGATCLAFAPDGGRLAAARGDGVALWHLPPVPSDPTMVALGAPAAALAWRADGARLAAALGPKGVGIIDTDAGCATGLRGFPAPVRSLGWSRPAAALVAAGAFRIAAWHEAALDAAGALSTGRAGLVPVETIAPHPARPLVAAGYANGQVAVAAIGGRDELLLRQGGGTVTALAWSADGHHLAIGGADGTAAIATLPPQLFK